MALVWVALGGALGAVARYGVSGWVQQLVRSDLPWGTAAVNVLGCLLIGFLLVWLRASTAPAELRQFLAIGMLGSFTTFSTFGWETVALLQEGDWTRAGVYALGSLLLGLVAVLMGIAAADALIGRNG